MSPLPPPEAPAAEPVLLRLTREELWAVGAFDTGVLRGPAWSPGIDSREEPVRAAVRTTALRSLAARELLAARPPGEGLGTGVAARLEGPSAVPVQAAGPLALVLAARARPALVALARAAGDEAVRLPVLVGYGLLRRDEPAEVLLEALDDTATHTFRLLTPAAAAAALAAWAGAGPPRVVELVRPAPVGPRRARWTVAETDEGLHLVVERPPSPPLEPVPTSVRALAAAVLAALAEPPDPPPP